MSEPIYEQGVVVVVIFPDGHVDYGPLLSDEDEARQEFEKTRRLEPKAHRVLALRVTEAFERQP